MEEGADINVLRFVPLKSFVHSDFWYKLTDIKLHIDKLDDSPKPAFATIQQADNSRPVVEVNCTAFNKEPPHQGLSYPIVGTLLNKNTVEEFKTADKNQLIRNISLKYYKDLLSKDRINTSSEVAFFLLFSFADFKSHKYLYWFAFPVARDFIFNAQKTENILTTFNEETKTNFAENVKRFLKQSREIFFIYDSLNNVIRTLSEVVQHQDRTDNLKTVELETTYFCCIDFSSEEIPSWLLRQLLCYLTITCISLSGKIIKCINVRSEIGSSTVYRIKMPNHESNIEQINWIGWETNDHGKFAPRLADMSKVLDPMVLAEKSISLNLTLMKWRLLPDLDLDVISKTKYLLLGAGTLGCGVARSLLAWGAHHITFVDYGNVSLSNPVRQTLFLYEDAVNGGKPKATTAAERLKQIHPCVVSSGHCFKIPMPGHTVGDSQVGETLDALNNLKELIQEHDVIFLLMDSRESRWLPTMLTNYYGKMTINSALGFDSFLVMRHGSRTKMASVESNEIEGFKEVQGSNLGCYFCNDVVAPGNSMKDRTLDQQCTVTRPAVSNMASSLAVEMTIALLQHNQRDSVSAYYRINNSTDIHNNSIPEGILGMIPHSIRGNISTYEYLITASTKFSECIACSKHVLDKYEAGGNDFILSVLNSSEVLEDVTGISQLKSDIDHEIDFDSDED
ncbi:ubiquitin-like modifier-activating enzyme atg7 [Uranotaenia lowii]|uniref:ubiquitin-like modifier-activating enzyme atg7 n=1 Tax=Uranotaenia lowii TaxID=190385 RepID=UPI0024785F03|nr:ubiquitin-like modifier-activating enzyme atg7 [Uranotaenia lowii]